MRPAIVNVVFVLAGLGAVYALLPDVRHGVNLFAVEFVRGFERGFSASTGVSLPMEWPSSSSSDQVSEGASEQGRSEPPSFTNAGDEPLDADVGPKINLKGYGNVPDLREALERDDSGRLHEHLEAFRHETNVQARATQMDALLFEWAGAADVDADSRGPNIDARKLVTLEAFLAHDFRQQGSPNPRPGGGG